MHVLPLFDPYHFTHTLFCLKCEDIKLISNDVSEMMLVNIDMVDLHYLTVSSSYVLSNTFFNYMKFLEKFFFFLYASQKELRLNILSRQYPPPGTLSIDSDVYYN